MPPARDTLKVATMQTYRVYFMDSRAIIATAMVERQVMAMQQRSPLCNRFTIIGQGG